jgi:hypothetical protein
MQNYNGGTYDNNIQRGLSEEQEGGGGREEGDLSGFIRPRIKTQVAKPKKYTLGSLRD